MWKIVSSYEGIEMPVKTEDKNIKDMEKN